MGVVDHDLGHVGDRRDLVVVEVRVDGDARGRVDDELLREGERHPLQDAALDLARRGQRVHDPPDVVDGDDPLDPHLAERRVDRDLCDLAAEGVHDEAVGIGAAGARAVDRGVAELPGHLGHLDVDRAVARADPAVPDLEVAGCDLEDVARELEQGLAHLGRGRPDGGHHRRRRLGATRDRAVDVRPRVAAGHAHVVEREPELLGRDDLRPGQRAGADVLDPGDHGRVPVGVEPYGRVRRRPAAAPPDLRRAAHPAQEPVAARHPELLAPCPAGELGRAVVAGEQLLAGVRQPAHLVDVRVVAAAQLERVERERERELVDRLLERRRALHHAGGPEGVLRAQVRLHREGQRAHVGAAVQRAGRDQHREDPAALPHRDHGIRVDCGDRAVSTRAETNGLAGRSTTATVELLGMAVVHEPHRPARDPRELGRRERLEARALLGTEAAADELGPHPDVVLAQPERPRELVAGGEHPLGRDPGGERVSVPGGDGGVRLERRLHLRRRVEGELDRHLGSGERRLGVAPGIVRRIGGEALLGSGPPAASTTCGRTSRSRASAATPARAASSVSAATTAIGWPA